MTPFITSRRVSVFGGHSTVSGSSTSLISWSFLSHPTSASRRADSTESQTWTSNFRGRSSALRSTSCLAVPIALKLTDELSPARRVAAGLGDSLQPGAVRFDRGPSDGVDNGIDLETVADRLDRLVIDDEQSAVPRRRQVIRNLIANGQACHAVALTAHSLIDQSPRRSAADLLWSARFRGSVETSCGSSERATEVPRLSRWLYYESLRRRRNSRGGPQKKRESREIGVSGRLRATALQERLVDPERSRPASRSDAQRDTAPNNRTIRLFFPPRLRQTHGWLMPC